MKPLVIIACCRSRRPPIKQKDGEINRINFVVTVYIHAGVCKRRTGLPVEKQYREINRIYLTIIVKVGYIASSDWNHRLRNSRRGFTPSASAARRRLNWRNNGSRFSYKLFRCCRPVGLGQSSRFDFEPVSSRCWHVIQRERQVCKAFGIYI